MIRLLQAVSENWALRRRVLRLEAQVIELRADNEDLWEIVNDRWQDQSAILESLTNLWEIVQPGSIASDDEASS